jgi:hypothetical protein
VVLHAHRILARWFRRWPRAGEDASAVVSAHLWALKWCHSRRPAMLETATMSVCKEHATRPKDSIFSSSLPGASTSIAMDEQRANPAKSAQAHRSVALQSSNVAPRLWPCSTGSKKWLSTHSTGFYSINNGDTGSSLQVNWPCCRAPFRIRALVKRIKRMLAYISNF